MDSTGTSTSLGTPRFANNPLQPGAPVLLSQNSFVSRVANPIIGTPTLGGQPTFSLLQLESVATPGLASAMDGLFSRLQTLRDRAATLISGIAGNASTNTQGTALNGNTGYLGATPFPGAPTGTGIFSIRTVTVNGTGVTATAQNDALFATYNIDVLSLPVVTATATTQANDTTPLVSTGTPPGLGSTSMTTGAQNITVSVGGGAATTIALTGANQINGADTNQQALTKIANAINGAAVGVTATIQTLYNSGVTYNYLHIVANAAGATNAFTFAESGGSQVVGVAGLNTVTTAGVSAGGTVPGKVLVNGVLYQPTSKLLSLDVPPAGGTGRVTISLNAVTQSSSTIDPSATNLVIVGLSADQLLASTKSLIAAVNDVNAFVSDKPQILGSGLSDQLNVAANAMKDDLASIGITIDKNSGALAINDTKFRASVSEQPARVQQVLGLVQGFASRELSTADTVLNDPTLVFATRVGPAGASYGLSLRERERLSTLLTRGLLVNSRM